MGERYKLGFLRLEVLNLEIILEVEWEEGWVSRFWKMGFGYGDNVRIWICFFYYRSSY